MKTPFLSFRRSFRTKMMYATAIALVLLMSVDANAQLAGIEDAAGTIKKSYPTVKTLIYAVAGITGLVGGVRIYNKWTNGDQDINKEIVGWGGAALFISLVPTVVGAVLGL